MPWICSICSRPDRGAIDDALRGGTTLRGVAKAFECGRTSITNHATRCIGVVEKRERERAARGRPRRRKPTANIDLAPIETPEDVLGDYQWARLEARALFEAAKGRNDWKSAERQFDRVLESIDRFARVFGMLKADATVNVDARQQQLVVALGALSLEERRAILAGTADLPPQIEALLPPSEGANAD